jgi:mRNA-degrading endonuclease toxin of MazEF toxin-antitoxin module
MVDKAQTIALDKIGERIGCGDDETLSRVNQALAVFLGLV